MRLLERGHLPLPQGMIMAEILITFSSGKFTNLVPGMQVAFLKSLQELFRKPDGERLSAMCFLFYGEEPPGETRSLIPAGLVEALVSAVRSATSDEVKERIWDFLLRPDIYVEKIASPEDFADAMFSKDALLRNRVMLFLLEKYSPELIIRTLNGCVQTGRALPGVALKRIYDFVACKGEAGRRTLLLTLVENASGRNRRALEQFLSEPLLGLNRFDYIRVRGVGCGEEGDQGRNGGLQLPLGLRPEKEHQAFVSFRRRASMIKQNP